MNSKTILMMIAVIMIIVFIPVGAQAANNFESNTLNLDTEWKPAIATIQDELSRLSGTALDVFTLNITGGEVTDDDIDWMSRNLKSLVTLNISGDASFTDNDLPVKMFCAVDSSYQITTIKNIYINPTNTELHFGDSSFSNITALESVDIPNAKTFGYGAFSSESNLTEVKLPEAIEFGSLAFYRANSLASISLPKADSFGDSAFQYSDKLVDVTLPNATTFGNKAFYSCGGLVTLTLENAITFEDEAFSWTDKLKEIYLEEATTFGSYAFRSVSVLSNVHIPKLDQYGVDIFKSCRQKINLHLDASPPSNTSSSAYYPASWGSCIIIPPASVSAYDPSSTGRWNGWGINPPTITSTVPVDDNLSVTVTNDLSITFRAPLKTSRI